MLQKKGRDVCGAVQFNLSDALESVQRRKPYKKNNNN